MLIQNLIRFLAIATIVMAGCKREPGTYIMTVNGPVSADKLGMALTHEHLLVDFIGADSTGYHRWDRQEVEQRVLPFLEEARSRGIQAIMECTPAYLGRDPELLRSLSGKSGVALITNTGYYGARQNRFLPPEFFQKDAEEIASLWIQEWKEGIEGTGIRPGFIKIGVDSHDTLTPDHWKIVHAAALTHQGTGLVIASHTGPDAPAFEQLEIITSCGIEPSAFIWVHAQNGTLKGNKEAAMRGAWISLDNVNGEYATGNTDRRNALAWYAERITALKEAGLLHRVLISHDAGWYSPGQENGGDFRGFTAISDQLLPLLEQLGFTKGELEQLMIINPREAFSICSTSS